MFKSLTPSTCKLCSLSRRSRGVACLVHDLTSRFTANRGCSSAEESRIQRVNEHRIFNAVWTILTLRYESRFDQIREQRVEDIVGDRPPLLRLNASLEVGPAGGPVSEPGHDGQIPYLRDLSDLKEVRDFGGCKP